MTEHTIGAALEAAVARMEANRGAGAAVALPPAERPVVGLATDETTGQPCLPRAVALPFPSQELHHAFTALRGAAHNPPPVVSEDEHGRTFTSVPSRPLPLAVEARVRVQAEHRAAGIEAALAAVPDETLQAAWLLEWLPGCRRAAADDYEARSRAILLVLRSLPALALNDQTAVLAAQRFEWLPAPAAVHRLLEEWLAPYRAALSEAQAVAAAQDPEPPARERPADAPLSEDEIAERRAAVARTMDRFRVDMAALRERQKAAAGGGKPAKVAPHYLGEFQLALALRQQIATAPTSEAMAALQTRLDVLLQRNPRVADLLTPARSTHAA